MELFLQALLLGIVEGVTEFIPVSSTGHLILLIDFLKFKGPQGKVFEVVIQLGAIFAICFLYREKIIQVITGLFKNDRDSWNFSLNILLAFIPSVVMGVIFHDVIKEYLFSPVIVAINLVLGGIAILLIERCAHSNKYEIIEKIPKKTALCIGLVQTLAMMPGISRSGATIMGSLLLGLNRKAAAEFSFFLAIPTMFGAALYDSYKNFALMSTDDIYLIITGFVAAFMAALIVVRSLVSFIANHGFGVFAYYRIVLGVIMLVIFGGNVFL